MKVLDNNQKKMQIDWSDIDKYLLTKGLDPMTQEFTGTDFKKLLNEMNLISGGEDAEDEEWGYFVEDFLQDG